MTMKKDLINRIEKEMNKCLSYMKEMENHCYNPSVSYQYRFESGKYDAYENVLFYLKGVKTYL